MNSCRKIPKTLSGIETSNECGGLQRLCAGKYLKPYQGLKLGLFRGLEDSHRAGKYLKPYQGLKQMLGSFYQTVESRKIPKTLSGIETPPSAFYAWTRTRRKIPKTLSGIETMRLVGDRTGERSRKIPKTLSGIETVQWFVQRFVQFAGKYLKPYQGLKLGNCSNE